MGKGLKTGTFTFPRERKGLEEMRRQRQISNEGNTHTQRSEIGYNGQRRQPGREKGRRAGTRGQAAEDTEKEKLARVAPGG